MKLTPKRKKLLHQAYAAGLFLFSLMAVSHHQYLLGTMALVFAVVLWRRKIR